MILIYALLGLFASLFLIYLLILFVKMLKKVQKKRKKMQKSSKKTAKFDTNTSTNAGQKDVFKAERPLQKQAPEQRQSIYMQSLQQIYYGRPKYVCFDPSATTNKEITKLPTQNNKAMDYFKRQIPKISGYNKSDDVFGFSVENKMLLVSGIFAPPNFDRLDDLEADPKKKNTTN